MSQRRLADEEPFNVNRHARDAKQSKTTRTVERRCVVVGIETVDGNENRHIRYEAQLLAQRAQHVARRRRFRQRFQIERALERSQRRGGRGVNTYIVKHWLSTWYWHTSADHPGSPCQTSTAQRPAKTSNVTSRDSEACKLKRTSTKNKLTVIEKTNDQEAEQHAKSKRTK